LKDGWAGYLGIKSSIVSRKEQVRANEIALEGVRQEAIVGSRTTLDVLEEEQRLLDSRVALENANRDEYVAAYEILSLIGELAPEKLGLAVPDYDPATNYKKVRYSWFGFGRSANKDPLPSIKAASVTAPTQTEMDKDSQDPETGNDANEEVAGEEDLSVDETAITSEQSQKPAPQPINSNIEPVESQPANSIRYLVQIAAYHSVQKADHGWNQLAQKHPDILNGHTPNVIGVIIKGDQQYYRLRVGPEANRSESQQLCDALKNKGQNCWLVPH
jgi:cell division septation protein DedD